MAPNPRQDQAKADRRHSKAYMLLMLGMVALFHQADKLMFSMAMESIKVEFGLSDTQLGFINGFAFAALYAVAAVPLARLADRTSRRSVIAACLGLWSFFTALTSFAWGFLSLFVARLLVGVGEAGSQPASMAMIAARYPSERRAAPVAVVLSGGYIGLILGLAGAGALIDSVGWRHTFLIFGVPGLLLALIFWRTVDEPHDVGRGERLTRDDIQRVLARRSAVHLFLVLTGVSLVTYGVLAWTPTFFIRSFGMTSAEVGLWLGIAVGAGSLLGSLIGGWVSDRLSAQSPRRGLWLIVIGLAGYAPFSLLPFIVSGKEASIAFLMLAHAVGALAVPPIFASFQNLLEPKIRATGVAVIGLASAAAGQGLGPLIVGMASDLAASAGDQSLRYALIGVSGAIIWPLFHAVRAITWYEADTQLMLRDARTGPEIL